MISSNGSSKLNEDVPPLLLAAAVAVVLLLGAESPPCKANVKQASMQTISAGQF